MGVMNIYLLVGLLVHVAFLGLADWLAYRHLVTHGYDPHGAHPRRAERRHRLRPLLPDLPAHAAARTPAPPGSTGGPPWQPVRGTACWCWPVFAPSWRWAVSGWQATASTPPRPPTTPRRRARWKPSNTSPRPTIYTIDARSEGVWVYFDFSRGAVVPVLDPKQDAWDLAFKRYVMRTNGGRSNPDGQGAVLKIPGRDFAAVSRVPGEIEFQADVHPKNRLHPFNPALEKWYNYSYLANVLAPKPEIYVIRTQDGRVCQDAHAELLLHRQRGGLHDVRIRLPGRRQPSPGRRSGSLSSP